MFVILVYDAGVKRDPKILKTCRKYLNWVQNSVFEDEITDGKFKILRKELEKIINSREDYIIMYTWNTQRYTNRLTMGKKKVEEDYIF